MTEHVSALPNRFGEATGDNAGDLDYINRVGLGALATGMGIEVTEFRRDRAVATMPAKGNTQPFGIVHGGAYAVLGETLGSMHAGFIAPEGKIPVGVDLNATHTGSVSEGTVTGVCTPIHTGRSMTVHEIVVSDESGRRCSTIRITNFYKTMPTAAPTSAPTS